MESVIIAAPFTYDVTLKQRLKPLGHMVNEGIDALVISDGSSRVYISRNAAARNEFEPERLEAITASLPNPVFYSIDFSDIALCKKVLEVIADDPNLFVDNDHGALLPGSEFVRLLRSQSDWDWRKDTP